MTKGAKREPVQKFSAWTGSRIEVAVWENDGSYSVTMKRSYKKDEKWHQSDSYFPSDLLAAAELFRKAWNWIQDQE